MSTLQALELCKRFGSIAEEENHHPDLHITVCHVLASKTVVRNSAWLTQAKFADRAGTKSWWKCGLMPVMA